MNACRIVTLISGVELEVVCRAGRLDKHITQSGKDGVGLEQALSGSQLQ
jgi:hypothetical protein